VAGEKFQFFGGRNCTGLLRPLTKFEINSAAGGSRSILVYCARRLTSVWRVPPSPVLADFVAKVGAFDGGPSVIRLRATGFDLPALMRSTQLSLYAMH
jgi:hypothetical protein